MRRATNIRSAAGEAGRSFAGEHSAKPEIANAPAWVGIDDHLLSAHQPIATGPPCARESVSTAEGNTELALNGMFPGMIL